MTYPNLFTEAETIERAIAGWSLSRFGDGELRLARDGNAISQIPNQKLAAELRAILDNSPALVCIPNPKTSNRKTWARYMDAEYIGMYRMDRPYGSSFVTRPDNAPWIDTPEYWDRVSALWRDKNVTLVAGSERSLTFDGLSGEAASVRLVSGPRRDAYSVIDAIQEEIGRPSGPILLCLGATATVLADRLARKGLYALDLGHIGMFQKSAGAYRFKPTELVSPAYSCVLADMHERGKWGADGGKHVLAVNEYAAILNAESILDYGCGRGKLAAGIKAWKVREYDPGIPAKSALPKPCDLVVATDVLEHVEPALLDNVLAHIHRLALKGAYFVIATRPAAAVLPTGQNAHLIVQNSAFWVKNLLKAGWTAENMHVSADGDREVKIWAW